MLPSPFDVTALLLEPPDTEVFTAKATFFEPLFGTEATLLSPEKWTQLSALLMVQNSSRLTYDAVSLP